VFLTLSNALIPKWFEFTISTFYVVCNCIRHFVISHFAKLKYLDDSIVTREERAEAIKIYGRRIATGNGTMERDKPSTLVGLNTLDSFVHLIVWCLFGPQKRKGASATANHHRKQSKRSASSSKQL